MPRARSSAALVVLAAAALAARSQAGTVNAQSCSRCHAAIHQQWAESLHARMLQPATAQSVKGDFARGRVILRGSTYLLRHRQGKYYVTEQDLTGKPWEHRVEYTLGNRRLQQYLTTLPDGRIIVLPPVWNVMARRWIHEVDDGNPEEDSSGILVWNKSCSSCHVSGGEKNFDLQHLRYRTTWQDAGVSCERCHGPGSEHVTAATATKVLDAHTRALLDSDIVNPARLDRTRSTMVCAQCHSLRDVYADGFRAGANYYDFFQPVMEYRLPSSQDVAYWPDGRPRWLANEAPALWESQCFLKGGLTCTTCHSQPHNGDPVRNREQLRQRYQPLCTRCHAAVAADIRKHTHHLPNSVGSSCIECHMPATVVSLNTHLRDHSISVPVPRNTVRYGIPNACNVCHRNHSAEWAARQVQEWYGENSGGRLVRRADAFSQARRGDAAAIPSLLRILSDSSQGGLTRANAAGYLGAFPNDPEAYEAVLHALSDPQPLVRATAAVSLRPRAAQRAAAAPALVGLLADPVRTVRISGALALVAMGVQNLPGEDGQRFERAKQLYRARAELNSDDAAQQFAAGRFFFLSGDMDVAVADFRASLKLDPKIPARYYLARALAQKGETQEARQILQTIPANDLQYEAAQRLLADLQVSGHSAEPAPPGAVSGDNSAADRDFRDGQQLYQNKDYGGALQQLEEALRLAPQASWGRRAEIYRAICLEKLGRTSEAEAAMKAVSGGAAAGDVDLQLAWAELLYDTGRPQEALQRVDQLIAAVPQAPMAYVWRAKVLLQLQRPDQAAQAAEESIRLQPDLPAAHNLLIRIYQLQGRTREAAQQAQWLRDYQRRLESR